MAVCLDGEHLADHPDSAGRPMPLTQVKAADADGHQVAPGEVGEIWLRSPAVAVGYWNNPEAINETFRNGWCRSGDLGKVTDDGFLVLTGRKKDMIRSGGENIYPAEVESVIISNVHVA